MITYLVNALGHHVLKLGFDCQTTTTHHARPTPAAPSTDWTRTSAARDVYDYRRYGQITDTDTINDEPG